jgi:hypothetical protein
LVVVIFDNRSLMNSQFGMPSVVPLRNFNDG